MAEIKFYQDAAKTIQVYPEINPDGNYPGVTVGLADNLTSEEGITDEDTWQYRTSGGELDISDGYAQLSKLIGHSESSTIEEKLTYTITSAETLEISVNTATFRSQISTSGVYDFVYVPIVASSSTDVYLLDSSTFAKAMEMTTGTYTFTYGASISVEDESSRISGTFNQSTFVTKVNQAPGNYTFIYNGSNWTLNGTTVTMSQYGITTTGSEVEGDQIIVIYTANQWQYSNEWVDMSTYGITTTTRENIGDTIIVNYTANQWQLNSAAVTLGTYGITITSGTPTADDLIKINYIAEQTGVVLNSNPTELLSTGMNLFNKEGTQIFTGKKINSDGSWSDNANYNVIYFKVTPETYTIENLKNENLGYAAYSETIPVSGTAFSETLTVVTSSEWATTLVNTETKSHYLIEDEGYLAVTVPTDMSQICCHLTWEGVQDGVYENYYTYSLNIPYSDINNTVITDYGLVNLDDTEEYYDEIDFEEQKFYKRTARLPYSAANLATVQALDVPYLYDDNYIYYGIATVIYTLEDSSYTYKVSNYGTEEFIDSDMDLTATIIYQNNLKDKLRFSAEVIDNKVDTLDSTSEGWTDQYPSAACLNNYINGTVSMGSIKINNQAVLEYTTVETW